MSTLSNLIASAEGEISLLFHKLPAVVKQYEAEALHITTVIKTAMASPDAAIIEQALIQLIPGTWETKTIEAISKALGIAIPLITNAQANSGGTILQLAESIVKYLQTLSPAMQNSGLLKLLSGILQSLEGSGLSESEADGAAWVVFAKNKVATA